MQLTYADPWKWLHEGTLRRRDLAQTLDLPEAARLVAQLGHGASGIDPAPARPIPAIEALGEVMALTRNDACIIAKRGV